MTDDKVETGGVQDTEYVEDPKAAVQPQLKSEHDSLGILATVRRFWKAVLVCNLLCIAAAADGYQIVLNGQTSLSYSTESFLG